MTENMDEKEGRGCSVAELLLDGVKTSMAAWCEKDASGPR